MRGFGLHRSRKREQVSIVLVDWLDDLSPLMPHIPHSLTYPIPLKILYRPAALPGNRFSPDRISRRIHPFQCQLRRQHQPAKSGQWKTAATRMFL